MSKVIAFTRGDIKNIFRDGLLIASLLAPILLALFVRLAFPWLAELSYHHLQLELTVHYPFALSFLIMFTPMMVGAMTGLILLDERDEHMLSYYAVTPLGQAGYLLYRLTVPAFSSFLFSFLVLPLASLVEINYIAVLPVAALAALQAPLVALFMGAFAGNKVEGLTLTKGLGFMFAGPAAGYLAPHPWNYAGAVFPPFWITEAFMASFTPGLAYAGYLLGGFIIHALLLRHLLNRFINRV